MKYEYMILSYRGHYNDKNTFHIETGNGIEKLETEDELITILNKIGAEGWDVFYYCESPSGTYYEYQLKRVVPEEPVVNTTNVFNGTCINCMPIGF